MATAAMPIATRQNYVFRVQWFGDSIPYGVGSTDVAGPREAPYLAAQAAGQPLNFCGSQITSATGSIPQDPYCEAYPGITSVNLVAGHIGEFSVFGPDVVIYSAGTNDIGLAGASAADVAASWTTALADLYAQFTRKNQQIIITTILKRLDSFDTTVQAANALLPGVVSAAPAGANVTICDIYNVITNQTIGGGYSDAIHPNDTGDTQYGTFLYSNALAATVAKSL